MVRHDSLEHTVAALARRGMDPRPRLEQVVPELAAHVRGQVAVARMDVIVHEGPRRHLVDVCVVSPLAGDERFLAACSRRDGYACRRAAIAKREKYRSDELVPFVAETGGRLSADARQFLRAMAREAVCPARELAFMYRAVSTTIQDGVARQLLRHAA